MAKAKGTTLLSLVKFLRRSRERATAVLAPELHPYLDSRIQTSAWYPEEDLLALIRCMLELMPGQQQAALHEMGRSVAAEHMEGVYSHLRPDDDLVALARRSFALWSSQHDSGRLSVVRDGPAMVSFEVRDFAHPSRELCEIVGAYFEETLRLAGLEPRMQKLECVLDGVASCRWQASLGES